MGEQLRRYREPKALPSVRGLDKRCVRLCIDSDHFQIRHVHIAKVSQSGRTLVARHSDPLTVSPRSVTFFTLSCTCHRFLSPYLSLKNSRLCGDETHLLYVLFLFVESMLFGLFTLCMLGDQLHALKSNQTQIDKLKNQKHDIKVEVNEVCGTPQELNFHWSWFFPLPVSFSETVREKILGYRMEYSSVNQK